MNSKRFVVLLLAVAFALTITVSLASANYVVIKEENGVCKVIQANEKTPKTIAGPFKTKAEAEKAKEKLCATGGTTRERTRDHVDRPTEKARDHVEKPVEKPKGQVEKPTERTRDQVQRPTEKAKDQGGEAKDKLK
jgi:hypothetical protein